MQTRQERGCLVSQPTSLERQGSHFVFAPHSVLRGFQPQQPAALCQQPLSPGRLLSSQPTPSQVTLFIYLFAFIFSVFPAVLPAPPEQKCSLGEHGRLQGAQSRTGWCGARRIFLDSMSKCHFERSHSTWKRKSIVLNNNNSNDNNV